MEIQNEIEPVLVPLESVVMMKDDAAFWEKRSQMDMTKDVFFKRIFAIDPTGKFRHAKYMIETVLGIKVETIEPLKTDGCNVSPLVRQAVFDSAFLINGNTMVIMEMQRHREPNDCQRFNRYANVGSIFSVQPGKGIHVYREGSVYVITFLCYSLDDKNPDSKCRKIYRKTEEGEKYCADEIIVAVELTGVHKLLEMDVSELSDLDCLRLWLAYSHKKEYADLMEKIMKEKEEIREMEASVQKVMNNVELFHYLMNMVREVSDREAEMMYKQMHEEDQKIIEQERKKVAEKDSVIEQECKKAKEKDSIIEQERKKAEEKEQKLKVLEALLLQQGLSEEDIIENYEKMSLS